MNVMWIIGDDEFHMPREPARLPQQRRPLSTSDLGSSLAPIPLGLPESPPVLWATGPKAPRLQRPSALPPVTGYAVLEESDDNTWCLRGAWAWLFGRDHSLVRDGAAEIRLDT